jgi:hypothetical protein
MISRNVKLALSVVAVSMLATPALAQRQHQRFPSAQLQQMRGYMDGADPAAAPLHYPNGGADRTGSLESQESGAAFNLGR